MRAFTVPGDFPLLLVPPLKKVRPAFTTPEDMNDDSRTAPSRRTEAVIPRYRKRLHGPLIAAATGLETIRTECPRFNARLESLETLPHRIDT